MESTRFIVEWVSNPMEPIYMQFSLTTPFDNEKEAIAFAEKKNNTATVNKQTLVGDKVIDSKVIFYNYKKEPELKVSLVS